MSQAPLINIVWQNWLESQKPEIILTSCHNHKNDQDEENEGKAHYGVESTHIICFE